MKVQLNLDMSEETVLVHNDNLMISIDEDGIAYAIRPEGKNGNWKAGKFDANANAFLAFQEICKSLGVEEK